ncbi:uncharacterized protein LOC122380615 [Amphibalanus amphitrite]|uniref:uncharacterized protein LOC122380615 n=1 Tax=Amphibalanus amphitrite TaxID=1232801 RepID=UPI001C90BEBA|nr:uncharacterized protein LOC122380615 [Amphibalanus amphitrite]
MEGIRPPAAFLPLPGPPVVPWNNWFPDFEVYAMAIGWSAWSQERQQALLLHCLGQEGRRLFRAECPGGIVKTEPSDTTLVEDTVAVLCRLFVSKTDIISERIKFRKCRQQASSVRTYLANLREGSQKCAFGNLEDEMIRDQFLEGCSSQRLKERLCQEENLTLQRLEVIALAADQAADRQQTLAGRSPELGAEVLKEVAATERRGGFSTRRDSEGKKRQQGEMTCFACGRKGHKAKSKECPARVRKCNKCHEKGHYAVMCKRQESSHACVVEVSTVHHVPSQVPRPMMSVGIDGIQVQMLVDTGSGVSLIPSSLYQEQFAHVPLQMSSIRLQGYGGHLLPVRGMMTATVSSDRGCSTEGTLFVVESHSVPLLGRDLQQLLRVTVKDGNVVCAVEGEDAEVLPAIHGFVHRVKVKEGATPVRQKLRPLPLSVRGEVKEHLEKLEKQDVIERVDSSPWVSPVVVTRRRTGGIRLCLDLKEVNKSIISMGAEAAPDDEEQLVAEIAERVERLSAVSRGELRESVQTDPVLRKLKSQLDEGWPARIASCPDDLRPFFRCRLELSTADSLIFKGDRIVVPEELRRRLLDLAHEGHQGTVTGGAAARDTTAHQAARGG